jgi:hypothetical protein
MLNGVELGMDSLPPRLNRAPGQVANEAKLIKQERLKEQLE